MAKIAHFANLSISNFHVKWRKFPKIASFWRFSSEKTQSYANFYNQFQWKLGKIIEICQKCTISRKNRPFRLLAVLNFGSDSLQVLRFGKTSVPVPFRFQEMASKPPVPRFRLEPTQLYFTNLKIRGLASSYDGQLLNTAIYSPAKGVLYSNLSWIFRKK